MNIINSVLRLLLLTLHFLCDNATTKPQTLGTVTITDASAMCNASYGNASLTVSNNKINLYLYNLYPISNITFDMDIKIKTGDAIGYQSLFKRTVDCCKFTSNPMTDPFVNILYEGLKKDKNNKIFGKCPVMPVRF